MIAPKSPFRSMPWWFFFIYCCCCLFIFLLISYTVSSFFNPNSLVYIYLHFFYLSISQVHLLHHCTALLFCLLFFLSTAHRVVENNPQTLQITICLFLLSKKETLSTVCEFMTIWTDIGISEIINYFMFMNHQP